MWLGSAGAGPEGAGLGGTVVVESKVGVRRRGLQRGSPQWLLPKDRLRVRAENIAGRAGHESPEEPGRAEGVGVGEEGGGWHAPGEL